MELGHYNDEKNSINLNAVNVENREEALQALAQRFPEASSEKLNAALDVIIQNVNSPLSQRAVLQHEEGHRNDDRNKVFAPGISLEQRVKLDMMTEIKSNMIEASLGLQEFRKTGNIEVFDQIAGNCELTEFKEYLVKNPNAPDLEKRLAQTVHDSWLKNNNMPDSYYSKQIMQNNDPLITNNYPAGAKIANTEAMNKEYEARVHDMFSNIPGLGDMSDCVNPNFKLNPQMQKEIDASLKLGPNSSQFIDGLVAKAKNVKQATRKIRKFFHKVKKADKDGVRTPKEQGQIDQSIAKVCYEKSGRIKSKTRTSASNAGRQQTNTAVQTMQNSSAARD